jgi:hypothetical protein
MNANDMGRYLWRTVQRWSGDGRRFKTPGSGRKLGNPTILLLCTAFAVTVVILLLLR